MRATSPMMTTSSAGTIVAPEAMSEPCQATSKAAEIASSPSRECTACVSVSSPSVTSTSIVAAAAMRNAIGTQISRPMALSTMAPPRVFPTTASFGAQDTDQSLTVSVRVRSRALSRTLSLLSCPQAARMSRPRGVRTGQA